MSDMRIQNYRGKKLKYNVCFRLQSVEADIERVWNARYLLGIYILKEKRREQNWADGEVQLQFNNNRFLTSLVGRPGVSTAH